MENKIIHYSELENHISNNKSFYKELDNKVELLWNEMESNPKGNKPNYQKLKEDKFWNQCLENRKHYLVKLNDNQWLKYKDLCKDYLMSRIESLTNISPPKIIQLMEIYSENTIDQILESHIHFYGCSLNDDNRNEVIKYEYENHIVEFEIIDEFDFSLNKNPYLLYECRMELEEEGFYDEYKKQFPKSEYEEYLKQLETV